MTCGNVMGDNGTGSMGRRDKRPVFLHRGRPPSGRHEQKDPFPLSPTTSGVILPLLESLLALSLPLDPSAGHNLSGGKGNVEILEREHESNDVTLVID